MNNVNRKTLKLRPSNGVVGAKRLEVKETKQNQRPYLGFKDLTNNYRLLSSAHKYKRCVR